MRKPAHPVKEISMNVLETRLKRAVRPKDRLWAMIRLGNKLFSTDPGQVKRALLLFTQAEQLSKDIYDLRGLADALKGAGGCQLYLSNHSLALELLERALPIAEQAGYAECEVAILRDVGSVYIKQSRNDLALKTLTKCAELAELIGNYHIQASALDQMGVLVVNLGRYHEAIEYHAKSLALLNNASSSWAHGQAIVLMNLSSALLFLGRYGEALSALGKSSELFHISKNDRLEGVCRGSIGLIYSELGNYPNALSFLLASARILKRVGDKPNLANSYGNLMIVHLRLGNSAEAMDYRKKAIAVFEEVGDKYGQAGMFIDLGGYYLNQGQSSEAKQLLKQGQELSRQIGSKYHETEALTSLAKLEIDLSHFRASKQLFQAVLTIANETGDRDHTIIALLGLGDLFNKWGKPDQGLPFLERAVYIAEEIHSRRHEQEIHLVMARAFEARSTEGDLKRALYHLKLASSIKEEILGTQKQKAITELQIRSEIEKSEQETEYLRKERDQQKKEIEWKSQEIERRAMELAEKTEAIRSIRRRIRKIMAGIPAIQEGVGNGTFHAFDHLISEIEQDHLAETKKKALPNEFQLIHRDILQKLSAEYPTLTTMERKVCVLLRDELSLKQMAGMLKVTTHAIKKHRHAIRQKMKLEPGMKLTTACLNLDLGRFPD
jgi:tetratricopeptide (TPR) repeat protein/DNA-binding CsgD family transcriptional regulator